MSAPSAVRLADWLNERCSFLRNLEDEANRALLQENDSDRYRAMMRQKAMFLSSIAEEAEDCLAGLPQDKSARAKAVLERFSRNAENALSIGSVFYMSALLYPEDHKKGQPNDLEAFTSEAAGWQ